MRRLPVLLFILFMFSAPALAERPIDTEDRLVDRANVAWEDGAVSSALDIVTQGLRENPNSLKLKKLHGDILATTRRDQEALQAYQEILGTTPKDLQVRWAKWGVLLRLGRGDEASTELEQIAKQDANNPLAPYRLAQDLRKLDRLEESLEWYKKAVELVPNLPGWRLAMARARFDVLDGRGARDEVQHVLKMVSPGSPEETAARTLLAVVYGATKERGRRYQAIFSPEGTAAQRKEWASIRADAWRHFEAGRYQEAEPLLRKVMELKPSDFGATHDLGITLMELDRCEESVLLLEKVLSMTTKDEPLADTFFRIGQCLVKLERWSEALVHFEILYEAAIEFEESTKDAPVKAGIRVLDKEKLSRWIEKVRPHVPGAQSPKADEANDSIPFIDPSSPEALSEEEMYAKLATQKLKPEDPLLIRVSLMGRDSDYSWFRFVIPSNRVMRDDLPGGAHEFIPIDPNDTFPTTQKEIYLVFGLVTASYDEVPLATECFQETSKITGAQRALAQDQVIMSMNEQSGYFVLSTPEAGWAPGQYRCGLFVGNEVSAYTHADEVRFRIIEPTPSS